MSSKLLLPNKYKLIGWLLLVPATILGVILSVTNYEISPLKGKVFAVLNDEILSKTQWFSFVEVNIMPTLVGVVFIIGGLLVGFSKEKKEDEFIANLRLSSLLWAVCVNYVLLFLAFVFVYGMGFFTVMAYNLFTVLLIFITRFNYILYKTTKIVSDEK